MKEQQKKLITEIMNDDAKDGLYKQQTSIEWFLNNVPRRFSNSFINEYRDVIDQAKQIELDNMEDAWNNGYKSCKEDIVSDKMTTFEHYIKSYE